MTLSKYYLIGIGHRARQGKDTAAQFIAKHRENVHILHFADALYDEVRNKDRSTPLIKYLGKFNGTDSHMYAFRERPNARYCHWLTAEQVPSFHTLFRERNITEYGGMDEKDAPMLQIWGTDYRRKFCNPNYWVQQTMKRVDEIIKTPTEFETGYIVIADTRFTNEVNALRNNGGVYVRVVRRNLDGTQYIDHFRDPNHSSEIDIIDVKPDYTLIANDGDLPALEQEVLSLLFLLEVEHAA